MKKLIAIITLIIPIVFVNAQTLKLDKTTSELSILGTSTLHDWESVVEDFDVKAEITGQTINKIRFSAIVKSIKSGKSGMDDNTYKALKEKSYPDITFSADALVIEGNSIKGTGQLTIAGKTNEIPVNLEIEDTARLSVRGSIELKMTDYDVPPPTAVFGTIKTGDDITIKLSFTLNKN